MAKKRVVKKSIAKSSSPKAPLGVMIISILFYVSAAFGIIGGLFFSIGGPVFIKSDSGQQSIDLAAQNLGVSSSLINYSDLMTLAIVIGIAFILMGCVEFLIARGLWNRKSWARIITIILMTIGAINSTMELFQGNIGSGVVDLVISGGIALYLSFNREVRSSFN